MSRVCARESCQSYPLVAGDLRPGGGALTLDYTSWLLTACSQIDAGLLGDCNRTIKWHWNIHMWVHLAVHSWWAAPRRAMGKCCWALIPVPTHQLPPPPINSCARCMGSNRSQRAGSVQTLSCSPLIILIKFVFVFLQNVLCGHIQYLFVRVTYI